MISLTIGEIAEAIGASVHNLDLTEIITEFPVIDSRSAGAGTFFIALPGERVDGNDYAQAAIAAGARFAVTSREIDGPALLVRDTSVALIELARLARSKSSNCTFIGITGSQGKTTTKELLGHILSTAGETVISPGSFNNEIGLPLTILSCTDTTKFCVVEMGARHSGDIAALCDIARPTIGAVLVVGRAHVGEFGSREVVARAKGELIDALPALGIAILGMYDEFTPTMGAAREDISRITFGEKSSCNVRAADVEIREGRAHFDLVTSAGRAAVSLRLLGAHQIANALAAATIATALKVPIESIAATLSTAEVHSRWRMELHDLDDYVVINDSYNANPESMSAALRTLALFAQERGGASWAFLGKMHELGESEQDSHQEIGRLINELGIDHLVSIATNLYNIESIEGMEGMEGEELSLHNCATQQEALEIASHIAAGDSVLVKASRAEGLEQLSEKIVELIKSRKMEEEE